MSNATTQPPDSNMDDDVAGETERILEEQFRAETSTIRPWHQSNRLFRGSELLAAPDIVDSLWGAGRSVVIAKEQPAWIVAPTGIGKTTLSGMILKAGMRINGLDEVLGLPVAKFEKPTLYIAADRPSQIMRALKRGFGDEHEKILNDRLLIWKGPLPYRLSEWNHSEYLVEHAMELGVGQVVIDSMKDVAGNLPDADVGSAVSAALNNLAVAGIDVIVNHHLVKGKPKDIDGVYGSSMMMNSAGTVILLWGHPGDGMVDIEMLKYADEEGIGPAQALLDQRIGTVALAPESHMGEWMIRRISFTVKDAARFMHHNNSPIANPTRREMERTRRRLNSHTGPDRVRQPELVLESPRQGKTGTYTVVDGDNELAVLSQPFDSLTTGDTT